MKSYTDIEQSKKLAEILPLESADMSYSFNFNAESYESSTVPYKDWIVPKYAQPDDGFGQVIPCWSLSALLSIIKPVNDNTYTLIGTLDGGAMISFDEVTNVMFQEEEIIDAVFEMVVWLKEKH